MNDNAQITAMPTVKGKATLRGHLLLGAGGQPLLNAAYYSSVERQDRLRANLDKLEELQNVDSGTNNAD